MITTPAQHLRKQFSRNPVSRGYFQVFVTMGVTMIVIAMVMGFDMQFARNGIKLPMANPRLRQNLIGKSADIGKLAAQGNAFKAGIMIDVEMHGRDRQVMMFVLRAHQA